MQVSREGYRRLEGTYIDHLLLLEKQRVPDAAVVVVNGSCKEVDVTAFYHLRAVGAADLAPVSS